MDRPRPKLWHRFQAKVLAPVIAIMAVLVVVTMLIVNRRITRQLETQAAQALLGSDAVFQNSQRIRTKNLLLRYVNVPNEPKFKAISQLADSKTMHFRLTELVKELDCDFILFTTDQLHRLASASLDPLLDLAQFESATIVSARRALDDRPNVDTVVVSGKLFDVISIPVNLDGNIVGVLTFGTEINDSVANEFRQLTRGEIVFVAHDQVSVSTLQRPELKSQFLALYGDSSTTGVRPVVLADEHYLVLPGHFTSLSGDNRLGYLLLSSYEGPLAALRETQRTLLLVGLFGVVLSVVTVWMLVRRITQPLRWLRDGAEAVGRGDFSHQVPVHSRDECGTLGEVFNQMTNNLKTSREQLEKTVETLRTTKAQLTQSEKLSAVGEFIAGVTHELNNPLSSVIGFAELLQRTGVDPRQRHYLDRVVRESQRCHKIVQSLLSFARQHAPERKNVDLNKIVDSALDILSYQLRTSNIEVRRQLQPGLPSVVADPHQIQQVFVNLINNARQAIESHRSRGSLRITTERTSGNRVRATFVDDGPGVSEENLGKIFTPFFTTKEVGKGTGLGLSLCSGIIQEHGGTISVHSRPGEGATFIVELPAALLQVSTDAGPDETLSASEPVAAGAGRRALIVDDEESMTELLHDVLTSDDFQVETANDGKTALGKLERTRYDVVVCDMKMPGMTGRELFERLHASDPSVSRRFVFVTGDVVSDGAQEFFKKTGTAYLPKPFSIEQFRTTVSQTAAAA